MLITSLENNDGLELQLWPVDEIRECLDIRKEIIIIILFIYLSALRSQQGKTEKTRRFVSYIKGLKNTSTLTSSLHHCGCCCAMFTSRAPQPLPGLASENVWSRNERRRGVTNEWQPGHKA